MVMDKPADVCEGADESKFLFDFSKLEFIQTDDDKFNIGGSAKIKETIDAPIRVRAPFNWEMVAVQVTPFISGDCENVEISRRNVDAWFDQ